MREQIRRKHFTTLAPLVDSTKFLLWHEYILVVLVSGKANDVKIYCSAIWVCLVGMCA